ADKLIAKMNQLKPTLCGATVNTRLTSLKPPMERTEETERLFFHAKAQALQEGFELREIGVGGTSDGNFTAAVGTPTLDGLGPVGDGAHASHEHILVDHIAPRTALLLRLFTT
ncbi:M20/M25/M40 family metallo-hydrolase, partial [Microbacteriaceae bacterium K1510]|nr:M20/M25/M40 family metallo-hydrolase [Microbacteriaceae bacterium K1510]